MKSLMLLTQWILHDAGIQVGTCTKRDSKTIESRFEKEGLSFLTITLPDFCKGFEQALARGRLVPSDVCGFHMRRGLPVFLQGFLDRVFELGTGELLAHPDIACISAVRQICRLHSKIELPTKPARIRKAVQQYVQVDQEIGAVAARGRVFDSLVANTAAVLFGSLLSPLERNLWRGDYSDFMPKHGPGATADFLVGNQKFSVSEWPTRLDAVFPVGEFLIPNHRDRDFLDAVLLLDPGEERPVRVCLVPKTMKTPRVIAIEPTAMQYAQQAVLGYLTRGIESDPYLAGFIGLLDQEPNRLLSQEGSISGALATLDLSEASDRVSMSLVELVFSRFPHFLEVLKATRSTHASVPGYKDGEVTNIPLAKFASMGSALCFPIEAMVFLTLIVSVMRERANSSRLRPKELNALAGRVRVFGDDIIVPSDCALDVIDRLEAYGLKVNRHKSFWTGKFRESCGKDWYDGNDVTYVKTRRPFPRNIRNADEVISLVSLRNQLYNAGYWETCRRLDEMIVGVLPHYPIVSDTSPVVGRYSVSFEPMAESIHPDLQTPMVKGYVVKVVIPRNEIGEGYRALLKYFVSPSEDPEHLERSGRPSSVRLKKRWSQPY